MTRLTLCLTITAALAAFFVGQSSAKPSKALRSLSDARIGHTKYDVDRQIKYSTNVIEAIKENGLWRIAPRHGSCWSHVPWAKLCDSIRGRYMLHQHLLRRAQKYWKAHYAPKDTIPKNMLAAFLCIHHFEGAWNANTGNGYYGGLQMDRRFQSLYGADMLAKYGTADNWTPKDQIIVAIRAYSSGRGFYPWPNTARACGLI